MKSLQLDKPHAIVVIGIQGSGKTFFAQKFADTFSAPFIEQAAYDELARDEKAAKQLMDMTLSETLKTGRSIVVELSLSSRIDRTELAKRLKQAGYETMFVWVQVDIDAAMTRSQRTVGIGFEEYRERMRRFSPPHASERALVVSGKHTFATQAKVVLRKLSVPRSPAQTVPPRPQQPSRGQIIVR